MKQIQIKTMLSPEELLKPRYKVIADWPGVAGKVSVGDIIVSDGAINGFWVAGQPFMEDKLKDYPHLFRKLQWWEERKPEDMPEYITNGESFLKVKAHFFDDRYSMPEFKPSNERCLLQSGSSVRYDNYRPTTETEYQNYLTQKNNIYE